MNERKTKLDTSHELQPAHKMPELSASERISEITQANLTPEIPSPPLPKKLIIGARRKAMEVFEAPTEEYSGVGGA